MIENPQDPAECRNRALRLLSLRTHFSAELRRKLSTRGFEEATIESVLERLTQEKWLDDYAAGLEFVEAKLRRKAMGRFGVLAELSRRGVERDLADKIVANSYPDDEMEMIRRAVSAAPTGKPEALARRLQRLGFSPSAIRSVLAQA